MKRLGTLTRKDGCHAANAHLVVVQEGLALHELVVLTEAVVEQVTDAGVVG